ncbi:MAG: hypothetical protein VXZ82_14070 [Planctomycetota bacterium]|nr:hypothetical protein [Planctomycetota bacterium]
MPKKRKQDTVGPPAQELEREIERAIASVIERYPALPIGPDQLTMHFMAEVAMAAYEAAIRQHEDE